ncbi:MAG: 3' terminal RNA ribose 2'-O-methyltransferase Hen1 [Deltaproteobacteria bacterium]|nr:3' terminal RNA ribose 2'-O-methyltransferase Hen1 [Deltaproteobacteria bacterium]
MLLTITTTTPPATDLGWLLHKHPDKVQTFSLPFGSAIVFYPEATETRCSAALMLDVDPIGLVRGKPGSQDGGLLDQYVNDRPYAASSLLCVALSRVFGTAMGGRCADRPELVDRQIDLEATIPALPCRGGAALLRRLFEPLGYEVTAEQAGLDPSFPAWGASPYHRVTLHGRQRLQDLLSHLYVLIPVLDDRKHYWVGDDEVEKLLRHGERWLAGHPERELIARRYLKHRHSLAREALARLTADETPDPEAAQRSAQAEEAVIEETVRLNDQRTGAVIAALRAEGARRIVDLGCGEGRLIGALLQDKTVERVLGMDVSHRVLEIAAERLHLDRMSERQKARVDLVHGSLLYRDRRLDGFDAATVVEVVEHLDPPRLAAFERVVFECARPRSVVLTTPNVEYNARLAGLPSGRLRHRDHRFEWTRAEFTAWATRVAATHGYQVRFQPVGPEDPEVGAPTQMGVFRLGAA